MSLSARTGGASRKPRPTKSLPPCGGAKGRAHIVRPTAARRVVLRHCEEGRRPDAAIRIPRTRRILTAPSGPRNDGSAGASPRPTWFTPSVGAGVLTGPRAATWGRPYGVFGPLWSIGADLRVRPPVLGAHIGAPLRRRAGVVAPYTVHISAGAGAGRPLIRPCGPPSPQGEGTARRGRRALHGAYFRRGGAQKIINYQFSIINSSFLTPSSPQAPYRSLSPDGESSLIPLLRLSPPNPRLSPLGFGGGPKNSYLLSPLSTLHSQFSSIRFRYCPV